MLKNMKFNFAIYLKLKHKYSEVWSLIILGKKKRNRGTDRRKSNIARLQIEKTKKVGGIQLILRQVNKGEKERKVKRGAAIKATYSSSKKHQPILSSALWARSSGTSSNSSTPSWVLLSLFFSFLLAFLSVILFLSNRERQLIKGQRGEKDGEICGDPGCRGENRGSVSLPLPTDGSDVLPSSLEQRGKRQPRPRA